MLIESIDASWLRIPFRIAFVHAAAERAETETLWVTARSHGGAVGHGEGCPRRYVTGESVATGQAFVNGCKREWYGSIDDIATLSAWIDDNAAKIDANPAAWSAVELALLDMIGKTQRRSLESLIGSPRVAGHFSYSAVLGDASAVAFERQLGAYLRAGFRDFKIKLSGDLERDRSKIRAMLAAGIAPNTVRADANNLWADPGIAIAYLEALGFGFWALEEPLGARDYDGMRRISDAIGALIVLDESMCRTEQLDAVDRDADRWIVNVRISKMGGLLRALRFAEEARRRGLMMIAGAHVGETSLLTRAALSLVNGFRDRILAQEGAFGTHLLECDVVDEPLMFGRGGILDSSALGIGLGAGLGLRTEASYFLRTAIGTS